MSIDYGMIVCEEVVLEIGYGASAGIGAGIGASGVAAVWAKKRLTLKKALKACNDDACREKVKGQIKDLKTKALKYGAAATVGGAGAGIAAKGVGNVVDSAKLLNSTRGKAEKGIVKGFAGAYAGAGIAAVGAAGGARTFICNRLKKQLKKLTDEKIKCSDAACKERIQNKLDVLKRQLSKTNCNFTK